MLVAGDCSKRRPKNIYGKVLIRRSVIGLVLHVDDLAALAEVAAHIRDRARRPGIATTTDAPSAALAHPQTVPPAATLTTVIVPLVVEELHRLHVVTTIAPLLRNK